MLAAIGETLENEGDNEVMGVVVNIRKGFVRLGLWTRSTTNEEVLRAIGYVEDASENTYVCNEMQETI